SSTTIKGILAGVSAIAGSVMSILGAGMLLFGSCVSDFGADAVKHDQIGTGTVGGGALEVAGTGTEAIGGGLFAFGGVLLVVALIAWVAAARSAGPRPVIRDSWE